MELHIPFYALEYLLTYWRAIWVSLCRNCLVTPFARFSGWLVGWLFSFWHSIFDLFILLVCCSLYPPVQLAGCWCVRRQNSEPAGTGWGARPSLLPFPDGGDQRTWLPWEHSEHHVATLTCFEYTFTRHGDDLEPQLADVKRISGHVHVLRGLLDPPLG